MLFEEMMRKNYKEGHAEGRTEGLQEGKTTVLISFLNSLPDADKASSMLGLPLDFVYKVADDNNIKLNK